MKNRRVTYIYAFKKLKDNILKTIRETYKKYRNIMPDMEFEVLVNDKKEIIEYLLGQGLTIIDSGSEYILEEVVNSSDLKDLKIEKYDPKRADDYIEIIDNAFNPLREKMGKSLNYRKEHYNESIEKFNNSALKNNLFIFTKNSDIIGICFLEGNILDTIVINPRFQGNNYGSIILNYMSDYIINSKKYDKAFLYVVTQNERAHQFYLRNGYKLNAKYRVFNEGDNDDN
ncbi:MAG: GNAT family N-acetyltransferase [Halanaerobiales bacterium]